MRIVEYAAGKNLHLRASPGEAEWTPGFSGGCLFSLLVPAAIILLVPYLLARPINLPGLLVWLPMIPWGLAVLLWGRSPTCTELILDGAQRRATWTVLTGAGRSLPRRLAFHGVHGPRPAAHGEF